MLLGFSIQDSRIVNSLFKFMGDILFLNKWSNDKVVSDPFRPGMLSEMNWTDVYLTTHCHGVDNLYHSSVLGHHVNTPNLWRKSNLLSFVIPLSLFGFAVFFCFSLRLVRLSLRWLLSFWPLPFSPIPPIPLLISNLKLRRSRGNFI